MADLLPPNATALERHLAALNGTLGDLSVPLRDLLNPMTCPANILPWLASHLSVDFWSDTWTEDQKRSVIASSYEVHSIKGTLASLEAALAALGVQTEVIEWWQETPRAEPYTFRVDVYTSDAGMAAAFFQSIEQQIAAVKPVRADFTVRLVAVPRMVISIGVACQDLVITTVYPKQS